MAEQEARRTLVKSAPELWAELSDAEALTRHLGELGQIRITRLEPETTVAWEGDRASGTVEIEPAGWGTTVTVRADASDAPPEPPAERRPVLVPDPEPDAPLPEPTPLRPPPAPPAPAPPELPAAARAPRRGLAAILTGMLDTLGGAAGNIRRRHATESSRHV
jgi:hypothetical protein